MKRRVWVVDHSESPRPIDGVYAAILAARDLASCCQLAVSFNKSTVAGQRPGGLGRHEILQPAPPGRALHGYSPSDRGAGRRG